MLFRLRLTTAVAVAFGMAVPLAPAVAATQSGQPARPVFRSGAELVRLDVRVLDENGRPIPDLRADEIEVLEEGQPRAVLLFQHVEEPSGAYADVARRTIAGEVSTNQGAPRGHLYFLIFDQHHITSGNEQRARIAAERFLRTRIRPGDRVALYALPGPGPQVDFTGNVDRAVAELPKIRGSLERLSQGGLGAIRVHEAYEIGRGNQEILMRVAERLSTQQAGTDVASSIAGRTGASGSTATTDANVFQALVKEDARGVVVRADAAARRFLLMVADVVRQLAPIEGRKTLVLFSEGFYPDHVTRELEQVAAAAAQSYAVIYSLDLNRREVDLRQEEPGGGDQQSETDSRLATLGSLAVETDGLLIKDVSANPGAALTRIADLSQDYYIVGFEPADGTRRGTYRRVKVHVKRPGARASTRTGYALSDPSATPADRRRAINVALGAPFPLQGLPIRCTTYVLGGGSPGAQKIFLSLSADLPVAPPGTASADVVFVVRSLRDGRVVASGTDTMPLPSTAAGGGTIGIGSYKVQFEAPPGDYLMRVVVHEPGGLVGSADRRFEVRRLDAPGVTASDLVLGGAAGSLPVRAAAYNGDSLPGALELYARRPEDLGTVAVTIELAPLGGQAAVTSIRAELGDTKVRDTGQASCEARVALPLEGIPPGDYVARAIVRDRGETVAEVIREVRILPGAAPPLALDETAASAFTPADILGGEIGRRYARVLADAALAAGLSRAADLAARGAWSGVESSLGPEPAARAAAYFGLRGLARFSAGHFDRAAADLDVAIGDPPAALGSFVLGWVHELAGRRREAIGAWRAAAFADPTLVPAHLALAEAYLRGSQSALAIQALRAGLTAVPGSPELREKLSLIERKP
jgi:VWFA-related protein